MAKLPLRNGAHRKGTRRSLIPSWTSIRSGLLFVGGVAGVLREEFQDAPARWELLIVYVAMMGLPWPLSADDSKSTPPQPPKPLKRPKALPPREEEQRSPEGE